MAIRPIGHDDRLSIVEHLDELRSRIIVCILALLVSFGFCYWQNDRVLDVINRPLEQSQHLDGRERSQDPLEQAARFEIRLGEALRQVDPALRSTAAALEQLRRESGASEQASARLADSAERLARASAAIRTAAAAVPTNRERQPVTLGVAEPFTTTISVTLYAALLLALPLILYQAYAFVLPAFTREERRTAVLMMSLVPVLFVGGVLFGYFVALPRAVDFLQNFNDDAFDILIGARDYYRFVVLFLLMVGLLFQIPVGVLAVTRLGLVSTAVLRKNRGYVLLGLAVLAAVATPTPDPLTMMLALAPLVVLFELSVQLARLFERKEPLFGRWDDADDPAPDDEIH